MFSKTVYIYFNVDTFAVVCLVQTEVSLVLYREPGSHLA